MIGFTGSMYVCEFQICQCASAYATDKIDAAKCITLVYKYHFASTPLTGLKQLLQGVRNTKVRFLFEPLSLVMGLTDIILYKNKIHSNLRIRRDSSAEKTLCDLTGGHATQKHLYGHNCEESNQI